MNQHQKSIKVCDRTAQVTDIPANNQILGKRLYKMVSSCESDDLKTTEFLELCQFVMRDANPECNGIMLRGNSMLEEKAM
jgi:hypothetical protein